MRYFLIAYVTKSFMGGAVYGSFTLSQAGFPPKSGIERYIKAKGTKTILNIFEFKSYQDYKEYLNLP